MGEDQPREPMSTHVGCNGTVVSLTPNLWIIVRYEVEPPSKTLVVSFSKKHFPLLPSTGWFQERNVSMINISIIIACFTIKLRSISMN